ncbi:aminotransferase class III-fold pyridoxal phosphate-dependent enzyme [Solwaraspora sp. WMMA2080]|uniref:aminotransferase class III-fold pyridoxal phosphate-dependent enzyme n=1 Tax=unclassified Solwaraspora TaxID=2627926 RepID=UPI00248AD3FA|nr:MULTISPECIES: aminotransferase class III-fold pyridoxal phosphate-dependent enzyme [unclassified Solwaraspora]WBB96094.1 aminotransferase class III-fold pyridoxal phosphate-dependent enzyme [Solwaraspora sp. WMMA2059]WBC20001.1 aminotransferase class III-fold pyridoxal phosphate-dependent enzyme [Solwaraspora sp. WMMA2080]
MTTIPDWFDPDRPQPHLVTELPGPQAREVLARDQAVTSPSLPRAYAIAPRRGHGTVVEDVDGNLFLDFNAGIAVTSTGHCHPSVVEAVQQQAATLLHYSASDFYLPLYGQMCQALAETAPMDGPVRVFLTNSGAEAVEGALKLSRYATGRQYVISFYGSFHGRTYGAMTLTGSKSKYHKGFGPLLPGVLHAPYAPASLDFIEEVLFEHQVDPSEVAAIFVEPIQGEGGFIVPPAGWLARLRRICDRHGILLVADEVQCGMGRTGRMWAIEHTGVQPDILISAKGIASGLPLGAFLARSELMEAWGPGAHGSTYGGSPVPCAAGLATLRVIQEEGLLDNATEQGEFLLAGLRELQQAYPQLLVDVRGVGLMIGVEFPTGEIAGQVQQAAFSRGLLVLEAGVNAVRMSPPLVITRAQAQTGLRLFGAAVAEVAADMQAAGNGKVAGNGKAPAGGEIAAGGAVAVPG